MILPIYIIYCICIGFIRIYKWTEFQILKHFQSLLKKQGKILAESIGIVLHCPYDPEWTKSDEKRVLSQCPKYNKLVHIKVHDDIFFVRIANLGNLGIAESYMDKQWDFSNDEDDIYEFAKRTLENNLMHLYFNPWNKFLDWLEMYAFNLGTRKRALQFGVQHYNLGNDLYELMLDPWMQYTCAYWKDAKDLDTAQIQKMDLIARKLDLKPGMRVLDLGCGWGTLCKYLAEKYQVECVGVTLSKEGANYGKEICKGLPVDIRWQDYRDVNETFDRIVSVGMLEHVGFWNYRKFFKQVRSMLVDDGIFLCHGISRNHSFPRRSDPFVHTHVFPDGNVPNPEDIAKATRDVFIIEDWQNLGTDYAKTLHAWRENFLKGWPQIKDKYDGRFYRMWIFYLCIAKALFASRRLQLWQIVYSKDGLQRPYRAAR